MSLKSFPILKYFATGLSFLVLATTAQAQTEFRGGGFARALTQNCGGYGTGAHNYLVRLRPAGLPGNDTATTRMSIFMGTFAAHFRVSPAGLASRNWTVPVVSSHVGSSSSYYTTQSPGNTVGTSLRSRPLPGGTVSGADEQHHILEVRDFDFLPGCTMRFNFVVRRVN